VPRRLAKLKLTSLLRRKARENGNDRCQSVKRMLGMGMGMARMMLSILQRGNLLEVPVRIEESRLLR